MTTLKIASNELLISAIDHLYKPTYTFFWGHSKSRTGVNKGCLSQWYPSPFKILKLEFPTAEHYMMATKAAIFNDEESLNKILVAKHPSDAKRLGRHIKNYDEATWVDARSDVVIVGSYEKFKQNPELGEYLLSTGDDILVEASPVDSIWGIGMAEGASGIEDPRNWKGLNLLGYALMSARDHLRNPHLYQETKTPLPESNKKENPQGVASNARPLYHSQYSGIMDKPVNNPQPEWRQWA